MVFLMVLFPPDELRHSIYKGFSLLCGSGLGTNSFNIMVFRSSGDAAKIAILKPLFRKKYGCSAKIIWWGFDAYLMKAGLMASPSLLLHGPRSTC